MLMKRRFLMVLLLCWPFVSMAEDPAYDTNTLVQNINNATNAANAENTLNAAFSAAKENYKPSENIVSKQQKRIQDAISSQSCDLNKLGGTTDEQTGKPTDDRDEAQKAADLKKLEDDYEAKKANEQSTANKTLTAVTTAAMGIGGMELAMGLSEQKADKDAANSMAAYIATMRCTYADGKQVKAAPDEIELPGGNNAEMMKLRSEYFALAADLKERKNALGMKPGIESEEILDKASSGLYDDENVGIDSGAYASLYRAQMLGSEADQAKIDEEQKASKNRVMGGAIAAGAGAVIGIGGNMLINGELGEKLKKAINEKKVGKETQALLKKEAKALEDLRSCLKNAGVQETEELSFSNFYPSILSVKGINCKKDLASLTGKTASVLFIDSTDADNVFDTLINSFGQAITGKMIGYTSNTDRNNCVAHLKYSIESVQKKFDDAAEKDKESADKAGISIGSLTSGDGLLSKSGVFSNVPNISDIMDNGSSDFLSSYINKK